MKNNILFIILSFSLLSCQHKGDSTKNSTIETIPVFSNYTAELPFSAFVDTIELIPLETTEDNLIGEITRVIFNDGKYYIRSTNGMQNPKLFVFNENGKYIQKISKQGVGPGEYLDFEDFTIANDDHIVLADYKQLLEAVLISFDKSVKHDLDECNLYHSFCGFSKEFVIDGQPSEVFQP